MAKEESLKKEFCNRILPWRQQKVEDIPICTKACEGGIKAVQLSEAGGYEHLMFRWDLLELSSAPRHVQLNELPQDGQHDKHLVIQLWKGRTNNSFGQFFVFIFFFNYYSNSCIAAVKEHMEH